MSNMSDTKIDPVELHALGSALHGGALVGQVLCVKTLFNYNYNFPQLHVAKSEIP